MSSDPSVRLGPFELLGPIATGGMGVVWRAQHVATGTPAAIKTLREVAQADLEVFKREVHAVARLSHPNIIELYDVGVVGSAHPGLSPGTPWLAMELADHGSLVGYRGISTFQDVAQVCLDVLAALSHSHARQIIHRDIKPGNVLIAHEDGQRRYKVTDFGIAHARGESTNTREVFASSAGTPWYMAPEQIESRWRDYGPWTDLYALGCLAWELTTGETPYVGEHPLQVARAHLTDDLPKFAPRFQVPEGFASWLERLLAKSIRSRFQRAADAAWSLRQIMSADLAMDVPTREFEVPDHGDTLTLDEVQPTMRSEGTLPFLSDFVPRRPVASTSTLVYFSGPPIEEDWRADAMASARPVGAGVGLFDYREIPLVGREHERDVVWSKLRLAALEKRTQVVLVRGPAGGGKTSFLRWIEHRTHETGAASVAWTTHASEASTENGLSGTLIRYLGCTGLAPERAEQRVQQTLKGLVPDDQIPYESVVLSAIMFGSQSSRFWSPFERLSALIRLTRAHAASRVFVLLIDDAHRGFESLQLVQTMLDSDAEIPVLIVVAANDDAHDVDEHIREKIDDLAFDARVADLPLSSLTDEEQHVMVSRLIDLEPKLESALIEASKGQPVYTLQLLQKWLEEGALRLVGQRFNLVSAARFPADVHEVLVSRFAPQPRQADLLKTAALIDEVVPRDVWSHVARLFGFTEYPPDLTRAVEPHPGGFAFVSSLVREAFVALAQRDGTAAGIHRVLAEVYAGQSGMAARRREASHRLAGGDHRQAIPPILGVIAQFGAERRLAEAMAWVQLARTAVSEAELPKDDPHVIKLWRLRAALAYGAGDLGEALDASAWVLDHASDGMELAEAWRISALAHMRRGDFREAERHAQRALLHAVEGGSPKIQGDAHRTLGWVELRQGSIESAVQEMQAAAACYRQTEDAASEGLAATGVCSALRLLGRFEEAHRWLDQSRSLVTAERHRGPWGEMQLEVGVLAENEDRLTEARTALLASIEALKTVGNPVRFVAQICLAIVDTRCNDAARAQQELLLVLEESDRTAPIFGYFARVALAYVASVLRSGSQWDHWYQDCRLRQATFRDLDLARYLVSASREWASLSDKRRQREALELASALCGPGPTPIRRHIDMTLGAM